ncbi:hypothetical protein K1T71_003894 [Dendrolimus kikuchii]|uniref:Uncharacterized protein n=1 Tax=Dendrolimus kikuchii TaxID=765133 RepID=A0ACC1D9E3_9NEOP|nr:hypothetical protein K1T71_003894 [Dendrolimus kikuchii]
MRSIPLSELNHTVKAKRCLDIAIRKFKPGHPKAMSGRCMPCRTFDAQPEVLQLRNEEKYTGYYTEKTKKVEHNISILGDEFMLDGKPLQIVSGSLHYFRLPAAYWRDRLRKFKAVGLNTVSTYVEWSYHETEERQYDFEGDRDIVSFIKIAAEEGLHVLLRPGPYICGERDLGGFPYWLLGKYPNIKLRSTDKDFMEETRIWFEILFKKLKPLLFGNGGPIILVQVENEYGSYASDMNYKIQLRDIMLEHVGRNAILYTTDGAWYSYFSKGAIPATLTTIDFGVTYRKMSDMFSDLRKYMPTGPLMNSEFYPGWLTHWGEQFAQTSIYDIVVTLEAMLQNKINVNFYMFFGGSNFEYTAGANFDGTYMPDITSYDYNAPLTEAGDPTPKYDAIRDTLKKYGFEDKTIEPPVASRKGAYGKVEVSPITNLLSPEGRLKLGKKYNDVSGANLPTFEKLRQRSGLVLYETILESANGTLRIEKPRDLVFVFVDGVPQGYISRMKKKYDLQLTAKHGALLSLLVENQGRINFGSEIHDYKGILGTVEYNNNVLDGKWTISGYPLDNIKTLNVNVTKSDVSSGPALYEGHFTLPADQEPLDTFLDTTGWGKGYVWINNYNLGRYWPDVGPQITLYVPGVWLFKAPRKNYLQILELGKSRKPLTMEFIDYPILNRTGNLQQWQV